jgi:hypothetical protein
LGRKRNDASSRISCRIRRLSLSGRDSIIWFDSTRGKTYTVEKSTELADGGWIVVKDNIAGTSKRITVTGLGGVAATKSCYRLKVP